MFKIIQHNSDLLQADIITINDQFLTKSFWICKETEKYDLCSGKKREQSIEIESEWTQMLYLAKISKQLLKSMFKERKST